MNLALALMALSATVSGLLIFNNILTNLALHGIFLASVSAFLGLMTCRLGRELNRVENRSGEEHRDSHH